MAGPRPFTTLDFCRCHSFSARRAERDFALAHAHISVMVSRPADALRPSRPRVSRVYACLFARHATRPGLACLGAVFEALSRFPRLMLSTAWLDALDYPPEYLAPIELFPAAQSSLQLETAASAQAKAPVTLLPGPLPSSRRRRRRSASKGAPPIIACPRIMARRRSSECCRPGHLLLPAHLMPQQLPSAFCLAECGSYFDGAAMPRIRAVAVARVVEESTSRERRPHAPRHPLSPAPAASRPRPLASHDAPASTMHATSL